MLEQNTSKPLYEQLMEAIEGDIQKSVYRPGDKLPTEMELESIYNVSRITVRRAVKELCDRKILEKKQGKGTFVLKKEIQNQLDGIEGFHDAAGHMQKGCTQQILSIEETDPTPEMAEYLAMPMMYKVLVIKRVMCIDQRPIMIDVCHIPAFRFPGIRKHLLGDFSVYQVLRDFYGVKMDTAEKVIKVRRMRKDEAKLLSCSEGIPVFDVFKIVYNELDVPVHYSISVMSGENTSYIISTDNRNRLKIKNPHSKVPHMIAQL